MIYSDNVGHPSNTHYGWGSDTEWKSRWTTYTIDKVWMISQYTEMNNSVYTFPNLAKYEGYYYNSFGEMERRHDTKELVYYIHTRTTVDEYPWWINFNNWNGPRLGNGTYSWGFA